jgi:hypothetical protein
MSTRDYAENFLVEQPAIGLFAELGWIRLSAAEEVFPGSRNDETILPVKLSLLRVTPPTCFGRETKE